MDEQNLSRLLRWGRDGEVHRTSGCPEEVLIAGYVDGNLSPEERSQLEDHLATCRYCLGQLAVLSRLQSVDDTPSTVPESILVSAKQISEPESRSKIGNSRGWAAVAAAAGLAAMLGLAVWLPKGGEAPELESPEVRSVASAATGVVVHQPREAEVLSAGAILFRWSEVPNALSYQLRLVTSGGEIVWQTESEKTWVKLPTEIRLVPGSTHFVLVRALLHDGKTLRSAAVGFQVGDG